MASITKRGNSYRVTVSNGRRIDGTQILETATYSPEPGMTARQIERAVREFAVDFERDVKAGQNVKGRQMTLKQLSEIYMEDMKPTGNEDEDPMAITTWYSYQDCLRLRILPRLGHMKICNIITKTLNDYAKELKKDGARQDGKPGGLGSGTIRRDCCVISAMLSWAVGQGLLPVNPIIYAGKQNRARKAASEYKVDYLTIEQTKALLWAFDNRILVKHKAHTRKNRNGTQYEVPEYTQVWQLSLMWRAYFYVSLFVGDRRGENLALTWECIDMETGAVNIERSTAYVHKQIIQKMTKTKKSRTPVLPPVVINVLRKWRSAQIQMCLEYGTYWEGYRGKEFDKNFIFTGDNGKQIHPCTPYHQFKQIVKIYNEHAAPDDAHKIPADATQNDLRHTAAAILIANGMDPRSVAGVLGHSNPTTTLNIYSYFFRTKNQQAADIMAAQLLPDQSGAAPG